MQNWLNIFDSDSDENEAHREVKIYKFRRTGDDNNFRQLYRFTRENVELLINFFLPVYEETRGGALCNTHKMRTFLRYIGDPGFQVGVGEDLGIHQSTVSNTVREVCEYIVAKGNEWIHFPSNEQEFAAAKELWQQNFKFPHAIGATDCTLIPIKKPGHHGDEYICRKNYASLNVQATCDGNSMFTSVDCSWAGSVHDARVWRNSAIQQLLNGNTSDALLLGDEAYPLTPWLMKIYKNPATINERNFNKLLKKERSVIERTFGQLKRRFPILDNKIRIATERIPFVITACFILHNVAKFLNDPDFECETPPGPDPEENDLEEDFNEGSLLRRGQTRRNQIAITISTL